MEQAMSVPSRDFVVLPLDARPVCYEQVLELAAIAGVTVHLPPAACLGVLKRPADFNALLSWWRETLRAHPQAAVIASIDTMAYGGLIAGRVNTEPLEALQERVRKFLSELTDSNRPRYGFSSILRIPNYDNDEEEPDYWLTYGRQLYQLSVYLHRHGEIPLALTQMVPDMVMQDFLSRREKNFSLNQGLIDQLAEGTLDQLVFCQDDTGPEGLNVQEAHTLLSMLNEHGMAERGYVQTGADEIALTMLAKALWITEETPLKVAVRYFPESGARALARFDGLPVEEVVSRNLSTLGAQVIQDEDQADLLLLINAPPTAMGDHCADEVVEQTPEAIQDLCDVLQTHLASRRVALADVVNANGADSRTLRELIKKIGSPVANLSGFAGWNTPGNTIGTTLAMGAVSCWADRQNRLNGQALRTLLLKRILDDAIYQPTVRRVLRQNHPGEPSTEALNLLMPRETNGLETLFPDFAFSCQYFFPCHRYFEVGIQLEAHR